MASGALVDTNVLLDVLTEDTVWLSWSLIGAHAAVERLALLTRDASRYRTHFPTVRIIAPTTIP